MYLQNEPRISFFEGKDDFLHDRFDEILEINLSDVGNTVVVITWIGFPGWKST
jgi:ABC-type antimicrobial peptide transport system permease subunit